MNILSIGNSFSQDAQRYLHKIAELNGISLKCVNLYIGGCSLKTHYHNILDDNRAYEFEFNGESTGLHVSVREALESDDWDVVTLQQASHYSFIYDTYTPYIEALAEYVRKYSPKSKIFIHETWAYEDGSERLRIVDQVSAENMYAGIQKAYKKAAQLIGADGIIKSGEAMMKAYRENPDSVHRDSFHASLGFGRCLLAIVWLKTLTGKSNILIPEVLDVPITDEERAMLERFAV